MTTSAEKDFQKDIEALRADISALTDTVGKLATEAVKAQKAFGGGMKSAAKGASKVGEEFWEETQQLGADAAEAASDAAQAGVASLEGQIRRNPMSAVLIALGVGFVVGILGHK
jgi:ElaB/YqjD/DUF883 family membrane-anchored ribosome-binding protein